MANGVFGVCLVSITVEYQTFIGFAQSRLRETYRLQNSRPPS